MAPNKDIDAKLRAIIQKKAKCEVAFETTLSEAGLDSLDIIELGFDIEDKFKVDLPQSQQEMANFTYGDLCRLIEERTAKATEMSTAEDAPAKRIMPNASTSNEAAIDGSLHQ